VGGQISERLVQVGEFIRENTVVVTVMQMNPLKLRTAVQERNAGVVRLGMTAHFEVEPYPGETLEGRVSSISPAIDTTTRTFPVEILVDNRNLRLKPGLFAKGAIQTRRDENALAISENAISTLAGVSSVYVIEGSTVRQQNVTLGTQIDNLLEVTGGLKGDEILASSNLTMLATGVQVQVAAATPDAPETGAEVPAGQTGGGRGKMDPQGGRP